MAERETIEDIVLTKEEGDGWLLEYDDEQGPISDDLVNVLKLLQRSPGQTVAYIRIFNEYTGGVAEEEYKRSRVYNIIYRLRQALPVSLRGRIRTERGQGYKYQRHEHQLHVYIFAKETDEYADYLQNYFIQKGHRVTRNFVLGEGGEFERFRSDSPDLIVANARQDGNILPLIRSDGYLSNMLELCARLNIKPNFLVYDGRANETAYNHINGCLYGTTCSPRLAYIRETRVEMMLDRVLRFFTEETDSRLKRL
ncbi:helix-turn-helix domain-containing protein [Candidatus Woesearchaeota archaeon]|nr:helix-turn-helix domain-containing protein [Candidatus Woesearchaeota archaeon]